MTERDNAVTWRAHVGARLDEIRAAVLDLIDCGYTRPLPARCSDCRPGRRCSRFPACSEASERDKAATDTSDGRFSPTPGGGPRGSSDDHSDATVGNILAWEGQVQAATTAVYQLVGAVVEVAEQLRLQPIDEQGRRLTVPPAPPTRIEGVAILDEQGRPTVVGRTVVDVPAVVSWDRRGKRTLDCRRATIAALTYVGAVADQVADRMTSPQLEQAEATADRAWPLAADVARLARRLNPPPPPPPDERRAGRPVRRCACVFAECPHERGGCPNVGPDRTCSTCRHRATAARKAAS